MYLIPGMIDLQLNDMAWFGTIHSLEENVEVAVCSSRRQSDERRSGSGCWR